MTGGGGGARRARWLATGEPMATGGCGHVGVGKADGYKGEEK
jgi:hypothetical protein